VAAALSFRGVSFGYGEARLFDALDLDVEAGAMTAVLGPNGAGKTTLVRLGSGSVQPAAGAVSLFGNDLATLESRARARLVAVVPQENEHAFDFSVRELVLFGRAPHLGLFGIETARDREIAAEAMGSTEVAGLASRSFRELSGGERRRVVLARALAQDPRLLLLDEPTAFLDLKHRLSAYALLEKLCRERGLTILVVSHDLNLAARHCDRLVLLRSGAIAADGAPADVLRPDVLRDVYEVEVAIHTDPVSGRPFVVATRPASA
jgi:iron complex transport system ATP-binding protein